MACVDHGERRRTRVHSFEVCELVVHDDGDGRDVWLCVNDRSSHQCCLCVLVVAIAWALAHHVDLHLAELTNLGRQRAAEAVGVQRLGWGGERTKHESVQWRVLIIERDDERECTALRRAS